MWVEEVIFRTYYYLHNGRILTDVITIVRIWQNTKEFCGKHLQNTFEKCFTVTESVLKKQKVFSICWGYLLKTLSEGH